MRFRFGIVFDVEKKNRIIDPKLAKITELN